MTRRNSPPENASSSGGEYYFPPVERLLTDHEVFRLVGEQRSDRGSPEQARALIAQFVLASYTPTGPSRELLIFVRDALAEYLQTGKSLESAFRLKKGRRGRPSIDEERELKYAIEFLRRRVVLGETYEIAAEEAATSFHTSRTVICAAFSKQKFRALSTMQDATASPINMTNAEHLARLSAIFDRPAAPLKDHANR